MAELASDPPVLATGMRRGKTRHTSPSCNWVGVDETDGHMGGRYGWTADDKTSSS